ncbi:hypothetical protein L7F22_052225 [Adiantum nelumboides]|nr:hypothetical protein [Adiantum nelumboides]
MTPSRVKAITKEAEDYVLIEDNLYRRGKDGQLRMCATEEEYVPILQQAHSRQAAGGRFSAKKMAKSILYAGIWWPTLFMDAEEFVKRCDDCQRTKTPRGRDDMPLRPMMGARAFAKWGIDFVGPCPPAYKSHAQYIIVATDYLTKWVEAKATTRNDAKTTAQFLYENIFTRYGLPIQIVSDRGTRFINEVIEQLLDEFMVIHCKSAPYHPQANGQAESTNKILVTVLTKIVSESRADWDQKLHSALWAYRVAYKTSIGTTPFNMVYGIQAILPLEFLIPTLRVAKELEWTGHGKNQPPNSSKGNSSNNKAKEKGVYKGKNRLTPEELERYRKDNRCFKCGEQGHDYRACPQRNACNEQPRASIIEAPKEDVHCKGSPLSYAWGKVREHDAFILFDPGSTHNFISHELAAKLGIQEFEMGDAMKADGAFIGQDASVTPLIGKLRLHFQGYVDKEDFFISPLKHEDVILGAPWFDRLAASIKFPKRRISFKFKEKNMYIDAQSRVTLYPLYILMLLISQ